MAYKHGHFIWCELVTPNGDDAIAFWSEVSGFTTSEMKMSDGSTYRMLKQGDKTVGGVVAPRMDGVPPHFIQYVSVADVAASAARVTAAGGSVLVPPTEIGMGTFAVVKDPQGATFQLWRSAQGDDGGAAAVSWNELWAENADAVLPFYAAILGWSRETMAMPQGPYHMFKAADGETVAGLMTRPDPKVPPMWLPYLAVDDVDATVARARRNGGAVHAEPMSVEGVGRFAIIADRQGAVAGVIKGASQ